MRFIIGEVTTNLDSYQGEVWPTTFVSVPKINSHIESESGKLLQVVNIIHCKQENNTPYIKIEVY